MYLYVVTGKKNKGRDYICNIIYINMYINTNQILLLLHAYVYMCIIVIYTTTEYKLSKVYLSTVITFRCYLQITNIHTSLLIYTIL